MDGLFLASLHAEEKMGQCMSVYQGKFFGNYYFGDSWVSKTSVMLGRYLGRGKSGIMQRDKETKPLGL